MAYENGGWYAARTLHTTFIKSVMNVSLSWYKTTPVGRIVNRFSRDMESVDTQLAGSKSSPSSSMTRGFQREDLSNLEIRSQPLISLFYASAMSQG